MARNKRGGKKENTKSSEASSDDDEDSIPIAASLTKGTKAKKAAKGELSSPCCMSHAVSDAFLLACIEKRQRWVYEPVDESGSTSNYWDAPIVMTLFDGYMSHIISGGEGSAAVLAKAPKKRPLQMMSEREADEMATHGEVLSWSPELHYVTTGVHCCCLFMFFPGVQTHRTLLPPDDEAKSQDAEESKSEALMKVDNLPIAASIPTSLPIAASIPTPASKRISPLSVDWESYKAWLKGEPAPRKQKQATTKKKPASRQKREFWEYYEPALDNASKYWDVGVEGKRRRNLTKPSYAEDEARADSEDDPEDAFNPTTGEESSSESDNTPIAKKIVSPPYPPTPVH